MKKAADVEQAAVATSLREFAGSFATGVAVITARTRDGAYRGLTMNAVTSLSLKPPLYLICLGNSSNTLSAVLETKRFAINFLASHQIGLSKRFASKESNKFTGVSYAFGETGCPLLRGVVAACECQVKAVHPGGDHRIIIGQVLRISIHGGDPLIFHNGKFIQRSIAEVPNVSPNGTGEYAVAAQ